MPMDPCWVLLTDTGLHALRSIFAGRYERARWRLVQGTGEFHALVDDEPGTEHSGEREIAEILSKQGRCWVGYFDPPWISTYERGALKADEEGDPYSLALSLGCPLRPEPPPFERPPTCTLVAIGTTASALAAALGEEWPLPEGSEMSIVEVPMGVAAWDNAGDVIDLSYRVARKLGGSLYSLEIRADGVFRCERFEGGELIGLFDHPSSWWSEEKRMLDVLGATTPTAILAKFGLPT